MERSGAAVAAVPGNVHFPIHLEETAGTSAFLMECCSEKLAVKHALYAELEPI